MHLLCVHKLSPTAGAQGEDAMARRLDESHWRPMHTRIAAALGIGWMLDAFEVQIIGSVIPGIQAEFHHGGRAAVLINVVWFVGIALGALGFGYLADRVGRRKLFVATLIVYSRAAIATASAPSYAIFVLFRFITACGVGGEYSAVTSAIAVAKPPHTRKVTGSIPVGTTQISSQDAQRKSPSRLLEASGASFASRWSCRAWSRCRRWSSSPRWDHRR
jgi:hypothetical protein